MKRVLIITYYWPPSGGSGVQRWLQMSKHLPKYGWQPVVYTTQNAEYPAVDHSLEIDVAPNMEVIRRPIIEPYGLYKKFLGIKKDETVKSTSINEGRKKTSWREHLSIWIRGNLFIPDARRWWVRPSVRFLKQYLKTHPVDAIVSTGPPHSMHLIAMKLKAALGIPWIADFRDPWTEIDYFQSLHLTRRSQRRHRCMEHEVLTKADRVVTVAPDGARRLEHLGANNVATIYNGFERSNVTPPAHRPSDRFSILHLGVFTAIQNPDNLWQALAELCQADQSFCKHLQINLTGQIDSRVVKSIEQRGISEKVSYSPYIPHSQVAQAHRSSTLLLLLLLPSSEPRAKGLLTGKLFEYLASGRPILCIGPEDGDAAKIISETQAGYTIDFEDKEKMKDTIKLLYYKYLNKELPDNTNPKVECFSRRHLAGEYAKLLDNI